MKPGYIIMLIWFSPQLGIGRLIKCAMDPPLPPIRSSYQAYRDSYHDTYPVHGDTYPVSGDTYPVRCDTYPMSGSTYHNMFYNSFQERDVSSSVADALLFFFNHNISGL